MTLLFLANAQVPRPEERGEPTRLVNIRIASTGRHFIQRPSVSYDPAPAMEVVDFSARAVDVKQAFAQVTPEMSAQATEPAPVKARKRYAKSTVELVPHLAEVWDRPRFSPA